MLGFDLLCLVPCWYGKQAILILVGQVDFPCLYFSIIYLIENKLSSFDFDLLCILNYLSLSLSFLDVSMS